VRLPRTGQVQIDERKCRSYLLSRTHPVGRFKARVFAAVGFDTTNVEGFVAEAVASLQPGTFLR
jgi:hypothetical protein